MQTELQTVYCVDPEQEQSDLDLHLFAQACLSEYHYGTQYSLFNVPLKS